MPTWPRVDGGKTRLDRQQSLNANKRFATCDETIVIAKLRVAVSRRSANAANFSKHACTHYPSLRNGDSLFPEFDSDNFAGIGHRGYARLSRELRVLQNRLYDCTKFDKLIRYRCANLFFIVLPEQLFRESEVPVGWGALVESDGALTLARNPIWQDAAAEDRIRLLHRIAMAGTRVLNRQLEIARNEIARGRFTP